MAETAEDFLSHYGVKGMRWGRRRKYTEKKRDYQARIRNERQTHEIKKLEDVLVTSAKKGEDVLVRTRLQNDYADTVMTGKQFVEFASSGAALNSRATDIFATLDKKSKQFVLNENSTPVYTPSERR